MNEQYVMDACALIAFLRNEEGAEQVTAVLRAASESVLVLMNSFNLLEVYYDIYRMIGKEKADSELALIKQLPITIKTELTDEVFAEAGRLKASYRISLADSIALAEAIVNGCTIITADHHEFDVIDRNAEAKFLWIR